MDNRVAYEAGQDDIRLLHERISALEGENRSLRHELAARQHEQNAWLHRYNLLMQTPSAVCVLRGPEHVFELANPFYHALTGKASVVGRTVRGEYDHHDIRFTRDVYRHWYHGQRGSFEAWPGDDPQHRTWFVTIPGAGHAFDGQEFPLLNQLVDRFFLAALSAESDAAR